MRMDGWVMIGGGLGALLRAGIGMLWPLQPWTTLGINGLGCLLLGCLLASGASAQLRLFAGTGLLGGFTTFSAFSVECLSLLQSGRFGQAALYAGLSLAGGLVLAWAGFTLVRRVQGVSR